MYRVSPLTYLIEGMLSTGVANQVVTCANNEYLRFSAPSGQTCGEYMQPYISGVGGYLNSNTTGSCEFCTYSDTNVFLSRVSASYSHAWRGREDLDIHRCACTNILLRLWHSLGLYRVQCVSPRPCVEYPSLFDICADHSV